MQTVRRFLWTGIVFVAAVALGEVAYITLGENYFVVVSQQCYRGAQPSPSFLATLAQRQGIRTIVNLRGENAGKDWYDAERAAAASLGISLIDIGLSSNYPPATEEFRQLIDLMDHAPRPLLFHCHSGSDRTGLASMMYVLLQPGHSLAEARAQISIRYGHKFWSEARILHEIPDAYEDWLKGRSASHAPELFREWGLNVYQRNDILMRSFLVRPTP